MRPNSLIILYSNKIRSFQTKKKKNPTDYLVLKNHSFELASELILVCCKPMEIYTMDFKNLEFIDDFILSITCH